VDELKKYLPDFGKHLAMDSTKIERYVRGKKDARESSDPETDWGQEG